MPSAESVASAVTRRSDYHTSSETRGSGKPSNAIEPFRNFETERRTWLDGWLIRATRLPVAKLYFRYGTMDSAKTLNLLAVAHNYRKQGKRCALMKPKLDDRFGASSIRSRSGLEAKADYVLESDAVLPIDELSELDCIVVDEAQFLSESVIDQLRDLTIDHGVPVICFGLRTDFQAKLFPGSRRLFELADTIEEVKVTCFFCGRKAVFNLRTVDGVGVFDGPQVELGADEDYRPVCWRHYREHRRAADGVND